MLTLAAATRTGPGVYKLHIFGRKSFRFFFSSMVDTCGKHIQKRLGCKCALLIIESLSSLLWICWCRCSLGWVLTGLSAQFNSQDQGFFIRFILFIPHCSMTAVVMGDVICRCFSLRCKATWDSHLSGYITILTLHTTENLWLRCTNSSSPINQLLSLSPYGPCASMTWLLYVCLSTT